MARKLIGYIGVDSGQIMVGDPCYLKEWEDSELRGEDWYRQAQTMSKEDKFDYTYKGAAMASCNIDRAGVLANGLAVCARTKYGDGRYPVYLETDGRPLGKYNLVIEMGDEELEEEDTE